LTGPKLLSGGNPQIAKGYGEAPVRAYLDAVPGWKQAACRRIDAIVSEMVPDVEKAVKWNSPFYGMEKDCWFLSFHCYDRFVKVSFYRGAELSPPPAATSKFPAIRYHHVHQGDELGEPFVDWVRQASKLPGVKM
jgi:hypothetical protein